MSRTLTISSVLWVAMAVVLAFSLGAKGEDVVAGVEIPPMDPALERAAAEGRIDDSLDLLQEAYVLGDAERANLRVSMLGMIDQQLTDQLSIRAGALQAAKQMEAELAKRGPDWIPTQEEWDKILGPLNDAASKETLRFDNLQQIVEKSLPPERVKAGRDRMPEMIEKYTALRENEHNARAMQEAVYLKQVREESEAHRQADADLSPQGNPMPKPAYVPPPEPTPPGYRDRKPRVVAPIAPAKPAMPPRVDAPARPAQNAAPTLPPPPPPPPAPPIDEWDKHVDQTAQKYKFDDAQKTKAQGILKDLRGRAEQYRRSHADDYDRLKRMTDAAARQVEEKALNQPLDELFAELKERLDQLPTAAQREAAGGAK